MNSELPLIRGWPVHDVVPGDVAIVAGLRLVRVYRVEEEDESSFAIFVARCQVSIGLAPATREPLHG